MEGLTFENLRLYSYFDSLSDESLRILAGKAGSVELDPGTRIITEGVPTESFFFLARGVVEITQRVPGGVKTVSSVVSSGEGIGEMVMLTCSHRNSTVTAKSNVLLYTLSKQDFGDVIIAESTCANKPQERAETCSLFSKMTTYVPFARLESDKLYALMDKLVEQEYSGGEDIINQGDAGDTYYIVKSGRVAVIKKKKDGQEVLLAELGEGKAFGEEALIRDLPRNATIRALEKTTVLALHKKDFDKILASTFVKNAFPEEVEEVYENNDKVVVLDARIPPEFEDEHIAGAINIPIEWLRDQYDELDRKKEYFTYCTNDSRGMVAAFLLNINGFKARIIRGGLSAWTGSVSFGSDGIHWPKHLRGKN